MTHEYDGLGEFHDLFMDARWERLRAVLEAAFGALSDDDAVLDVGAGTGVGTRLLAASTRARIVAVEPSLTMRAVLIARVANDPALVTRVSVLADPAPAVLEQVPGPIAGFVCAHMLGHLDPAQRAGLFAGLAARLAPGGVGVVTVDREPEAREERARETAGEPVDERRIGGHRYLVRYLDAGAGRHHSVYEVRAGERLLRRAEFAGGWTPVRLDRLRAELAPHGLRAREAGPGAALVDRDDGAGSDPATP